MRVNIVDDLSNLTTIQVASLNKLVKQSLWIICDGIVQAINNKQDEAEFDLGIGLLKIKFDNEQVKYRFVPKPTMENAINKAVVDEQNPLQLALESALAEKLSSTYKEFF